MNRNTPEIPITFPQYTNIYVYFDLALRELRDIQGIEKVYILRDSFDIWVVLNKIDPETEGIIFDRGRNLPVGRFRIFTNLDHNLGDVFPKGDGWYELYPENNLPSEEELFAEYDRELNGMGIDADGILKELGLNLDEIQI